MPRLRVGTGESHASPSTSQLETLISRRIRSEGLDRRGRPGVVRRALEATLLKWGYCEVVIACPMVLEARQVLQSPDSPPQPAILDHWMMPGMDGSADSLRKCARGGKVRTVCLLWLC